MIDPTLDATAQAELVRSKQVTPAELLEAAIARAEQVNPKLACIVTPLYERARKDAARVDLSAPFAGVPFLLKDLAMNLAGVPTSSANRFSHQLVPARDTELVIRQRQAGLVTFGKTATSEFGILPTVETALFGAARNPWNPGFSTGGSSGGSAAAVAAGIVPMAHASDGGGSIRIPASMCGVFGFKPTRGRIPLGPEIGDVMHGLVMEHAVSRSVRDSARLLDATEGMDLGAPYAGPGKERPFGEEVTREPGKLRVAFSTEALAGTPVHPDCVAAVRDAARLLVSLGHDVEEKTFETPEQPALMGAFMAVWTGGVVLAIEGLSLAAGRRPRPEEFEPLTWTLFEMGTKVPLQVYLLAQAALQRFSRSFAVASAAYDVCITPTCGEPPTPLGAYQADSDPLSPLHRAAPVAAFTAALNVTGQPAMSVPLSWNRAGLPIGVQFFSRFGDDATLFRLAGQLERARPWAARRPPISAV